MRWAVLDDGNQARASEINGQVYTRLTELTTSWEKTWLREVHTRAHPTAQSADDLAGYP